MNLMQQKIRKLHFVGIGGIGMSSIAENLLKQGFKISGSDKSLSDVTDRLSYLGAEIFEGHSEDNLKDVDVVVFTSAASMENQEIIFAKKKNIPVIKRDEMLAEFMRLKEGICIAGTHGKTTTTSMIGLILIEADLDPSIIVGGKVSYLQGSNARLGKSNLIVVEADEYDRTFLKLTPVIAVVNNIELEHLDTYKDLADIKNSFADFVNRIPFYGFAAMCLDEKNVEEIIQNISKKVITFGIKSDAEIKAVDIVQDKSCSQFKVKQKNEIMGEIKLIVPGIHNIKNALAAITVALELKIDFKIIKDALVKFSGVNRRFEIKYDKEILVIDDYAHHPSEVEATLMSIKAGWNRRIVAVFQPHLYSRTKDFYKDFAMAFLNSDIFICTDVYPAREKEIEGVSGALVTEAAKKLGHQNVFYVPDKKNLIEKINEIKNVNDIIITMGAGDITNYCESFVSTLKN